MIPTLQLLKNSKIQRLCETREKLIEALEESLVFSLKDDNIVTADLDLSHHENLSEDSNISSSQEGAPETSTSPEESEVASESWKPTELW